MINVEAYEIGYLVYQETLNLENLFAVTDAKLLTESVDEEALNEAMIDTIRGYVNKVVSGIGKVWQKFKTRIQHIRKDILLKQFPLDKMKEILSKSNAKPVEVENYREYDLGKLFSIRFMPFTMDLVGDAQNKNDFYTKHYAGVIKDTDRSVADNLRDYITKAKSNKFAVPAEKIQDMVDFVIKEEGGISSAIENNIQQMNRSVQNIDNIASQVTKEGFSYEKTMQYYFNEADEDPKMKVVSDKSADGNGEEKKEQGDDGKALKKATEVYLSAMSGLLSAQLSLSTEIMNIYCQIITKFMKENSSSNKSFDGKPALNDDGKFHKVQL